MAYLRANVAALPTLNNPLPIHPSIHAAVTIMPAFNTYVLDDKSITVDGKGALEKRRRAHATTHGT